MTTGTKWNNVFLLPSSQVLYQTSSFIGSTLSALAGLQLAPNEGLVTRPVSVVSLGTAAMIIPASLIKNYGVYTVILIGIVIPQLKRILCTLYICKVCIYAVV